MARAVKWTETIGGVATAHQIDAEDADFAALQSFIAVDPSPARYVTVGAAVMPDGSVLSIGPNGEVYQDARRLPGIAAQKIAQVGKTIYALGLTSPKWWRWTGATWALVTDFDANLLR